MSNRALLAVILSLAATAPVFARGGGGGGGGRGGGGGGGGFGGQGGQGGQAGGFGGQQAQGGFGGAGGGGRQGGGQQNPGGFQAGTGGGRNQGGTQVQGFGSNRAQAAEDYSILDSTSIFARDRRAQGFEVQAPVVQVPVVDRGTIPIFRGVIKDDSGFVAILETTIDGKTTTVQVRTTGTIPYDGSKVEEISLDEMMIKRGGQDNLVHIPIGYTIAGEAAPVLTGVQYISGDLLAAQQQAFNSVNQAMNGGRGGRGGQGGGRGGQGAQGGFGGQGAFGQQGGQQGGIYTGGMTGAMPLPTGSTAAPVALPPGTVIGGVVIGGAAANTTNNVVNPALDPPLPAGSSDSIEARMAQRRALQMGN